MKSWQRNPLPATPGGVVEKHNGATLSPSEGFLMCLKQASPLRGHLETCPSGLKGSTHSRPPCPPHPMPPVSFRTHLRPVPKLHWFKHTSSGSPPAQRALWQPVPQWGPVHSTVHTASLLLAALPRDGCRPHSHPRWGLNWYQPQLGWSPGPRGPDEAPLTIHSPPGRVPRAA